jgi:hypothetical protein
MELFSQKKNYILSIVLFGIWVGTVLLNITTHPSWLYMSLWIATLIIGIIANHKNKINLNILQINWIIFIVYAFFVTIFNSLIGRYIQFDQFDQIKLIVNEIKIYILPVVAILLVTNLCDKQTFLRLYRNFVSFFSFIGVYEILTHNQFYSRWITSTVAKNNFQTYGDISLSNYRTTLIFYHPYFYSVILVIFLICLLYVPFKSEVLQILFFTLGLINLFFTQTRASWISLFGILFLYFVNNGGKSLGSLRRLMILVIIVFFLYNILLMIPSISDWINQIFLSRINVLFNGNIDQASGARLGQLGLIQHNNTLGLKLFGGGENFAINILQIYPVNGWNLSIDNQYLMVAMDYGIIGLSIYLIFVLNSFKSYFLASSKIDKAISLSIISILISSIFFSTYKQSEINYLMFMLIGMSSIPNKCLKGESNE